MNIGVISSAFAAAAVCAAVMGYAIQRGATCTVAAVDEVLSQRSCKRLAALVEASLWVGGGLLLAQTLHRLPAMPAGYALGITAVSGGALLGLGAWVNRACVFGAIARLGSGEWAYALTPLGFYCGCLSLVPLFGVQAPHRLTQGSPVLQAPPLLALLFVAFVGWRLARIARAGRGMLRQRLWAPHQATLVIGVTFLAMLMLVGAWAYTDLLSELARGMASSLAARCLLLLALLAGAAWGGWTAGRWRHTPVSAAQAARCFGGGLLMGWGSLLIPGGNDGLILVGMPLLWPYAWVAFASMCLAIAAAQTLQRRRSSPQAA